MNPPGTPSERFFCYAHEKLTGPFDVIELAGELKRASINADTLVCREGEETWVTFNTLPEYATAQKMSIDAIARHLEIKSYGTSSSQSSADTHASPWFVMIVIIFVAGAILTALFLSTPSTPVASAPTPAPQPAAEQPWRETHTASFSISAPVLMVKTSTTRIMAESYKASLPGVVFYVGRIAITDAQGHLLHNPTTLESIRLGLLNDMVALERGKLISKTDITGPEFHGQEVSFTRITDDDIAESGKARFIETDRSMFIISVVSETGKLIDADKDRFLESFHITPDY